MKIPIISQLREAKIDKSSSLLEGIILKAGKSSNGTFYSREIIQNSAEIFEGVKCFADHPKDSAENRSVRDVVGVVEKSWSEKDAIKARIRFSSAHDWLLTMIEEGLLGDLSINAVGRTKVSRRDGEVVREVLEITKAYSVDFVTHAAAGGRIEKILRESESCAEGLKIIENISLDELTEARPDLIDQFAEKIRSKLTHSLEESLKEIEEFKMRIENARFDYRKKELVLSILKDSKLPELTVDFILSESMNLQVSDENKFKEDVIGLIEKHRSYLADIASTGLIKGMGTGKFSDSDDINIKRQTLKLMGIG